jgi:hypothetical protein
MVFVATDRKGEKPMTPDERIKELNLILPAPLKLPANVRLPFFLGSAPR